MSTGCTTERSNESDKGYTTYVSNRLVSMAGVHLDTGNTENIREVDKTTRRLVVEHTVCSAYLYHCHRPGPHR